MDVDKEEARPNPEVSILPQESHIWRMPEVPPFPKSNQMDVDKEEARPNPEVPSLPQERHIWRMPELPPIPQ
ncbi:hypothetical protein O181_130335, partial [Austropuccinia psidii MF-1]|nr:hypothetical protein [Austropuccinia psidii MF-1]